MLLITPHSTVLCHAAPTNKEVENIYSTGENKTCIIAFTTANR